MNSCAKVLRTAGFSLRQKLVAHRAALTFLTRYE